MKITKEILIFGIIAVMIAVPVVGIHVVPVLESLPGHYQALLSIMILLVLFILYMGGSFLFKGRFLKRDY